MPSRYPNTYDAAIQDAVARYLPGLDWVWIKAQFYQESLLTPTAISHRGAKGLAQVMDPTWEEETSEMRLRASPYDPIASALVGSRYMSKQLRYASRHMPVQPLLKPAQASYNAGMGNMKKFYLACPPPLTTWSDLRRCVPFKETRDYVDRIQKHYDSMKSEEKV